MLERAQLDRPLLRPPHLGPEEVLAHVAPLLLLPAGKPVEVRAPKPGAAAAAVRAASAAGHAPRVVYPPLLRVGERLVRERDLAEGLGRRLLLARLRLVGVRRERLGAVGALDLGERRGALDPERRVVVGPLGDHHHRRRYAQPKYNSRRH